MSLDLYADSLTEGIAKLPRVKDVPPGIFDNFFSGTGRVAMETQAKAGRAISMAGSVPYILADKAMGGTVLQDRYFAAHDDIFRSAVDYWTPKPDEVGMAGQVTGALLGLLPQIIANPALAVAGQQLSTSEDLITKPGVSLTQAQAVGAAQAVGLGVGIWLPILGRNLFERVAVGVEGGASTAPVKSDKFY